MVAGRLIDSETMTMIRDPSPTSPFSRCEFPDNRVQEPKAHLLVINFGTDDLE